MKRSETRVKSVLYGTILSTCIINAKLSEDGLKSTLKYGKQTAKVATLQQAMA